jgi:hypothetical protein
VVAAAAQAAERADAAALAAASAEPAAVAANAAATAAVAAAVPPRLSHLPASAFGGAGLEPEARGVLASEGLLAALSLRVGAAESLVEQLAAWRPTSDAAARHLQSGVQRLETNAHAQAAAAVQAAADAAVQAAHALHAQGAAEASVAVLAAGLERERKERAAGVLAAAREAQDTLGQVGSFPATAVQGARRKG